LIGNIGPVLVTCWLTCPLRRYNPTIINGPRRFRSSGCESPAARIVSFLPDSLPMYRRRPSPSPANTVASACLLLLLLLLYPASARACVLGSSKIQPSKTIDLHKENSNEKTRVSCWERRVVFRSESLLPIFKILLRNSRLFDGIKYSMAFPAKRLNIGPPSIHFRPIIHEAYADFSSRVGAFHQPNCSLTINDL
jgi:hypothetical protein